ncbi:uncharacterized protein LOC117337624 [Pecten maximus]|uniref:uncharacterized protein LOC117337624 n=1 Tax=Pecten maximus TaxID=6579 RepID=UPI001458263E|nr:uncharacterized protein LOC117337624 [Pecten maximus]
MALEEFFQFIEDGYFDLHMDSIIVENMYRATKAIVKYIVDKIGELDPYLNAKEIVSVGSFVEKTKIRSPNEFDFMACLDFLSNEDVIELEAKEACEPGYMIAFLKSKPKDMILTAMQLYGDVWCIHPAGLREQYNKRLLEAVKTIIGYSVITPHGAMYVRGSQYLALELEWVRFSHEYKETDVNKGLSKAYIDCEIAHHLKVDVDVMPAVRVENASLVTSLPGFPHHMTDVVASKGFHLVYKASGHNSNHPFLQASFATSEVALMQKLHPVHKRCYKLLKYLLTDGTNVNLRHKNITLSSYMFKTAVLFHEYDCLCSGFPDLVRCCLDIIKYVKLKFGNGIMPTFFMRKKNIWGQSYRIPDPYPWEPSKLPDDCCGGDWCIIMWMEIWRQVLNKAILIFQDVCTYHDATKTAVSHPSIKGHVSHQYHQSAARKNEMGNADRSQNITVYKSVAVLENAIDSQDETIDGKHSSEGTSDTKSSQQPGTDVLLYQRKPNDIFDEAFQELRKTLRFFSSTIPGTEIDELPCCAPKQEIWKHVVTNFHEYHEVIEKAYKKKINIPNKEPRNLEVTEIIYDRESFH